MTSGAAPSGGTGSGTGPGTGPPNAALPTAVSGRVLVRRGGAMALGTVASRATGFLRTVAVLAAIGTNGVSDAYNVANTLPNIVYDLLLGGVLASVVVPLLVRAASEDEDGGAGFTSALCTMVVVALVAVTVVGEFAAPLLVRLYLHAGVSTSERHLAVTFTRVFLPQLLFYALTALASAVLTIRGRFAAVGAAPVVNNILVIGVAIAFVTTPHHRDITDRLSNGQTLLLGLGTTLGVVAMSAALLPSLARAGVRIRPRWAPRHPRLRVAAGLGGWVLGYAIANQAGYLVITNLATAGGGGGYTEYSTAYQLFQLPYAIVAVSVISALMPGLSAAAAVDDLPSVRRQLSRGLRLSAVLVVPAALGLAALAGPIATGALHYGSTGAGGIRLIGQTLAMFAWGLPAFAGYQLLLRGFYARQDSRTPTLINVAVNIVNVAADLVLISLVPAHLRIPALAAGFSLSYVVGTVIAGVLLDRRIAGLDGHRVGRLLVRVTIASGVAAGIAALLAAAGHGLLGGGTLPALATTVIAGLIAVGAYLWLAARMRVRELDGLRTVLRR